MSSSRNQPPLLSPVVKRGFSASQSKSHLLANLPDLYWSDEEKDTDCPLCLDEMDFSDLNLKLCMCGYQICRFCWCHIKEENGCCPACKKVYTDEGVQVNPTTKEDLKRLAQQKKQRESEYKELSALGRRHLVNVRIIQRNVAYVVGIDSQFTKDEFLPTFFSKEFFGQYGKITKIVIVKRTPLGGGVPVVGLYITYDKREDAGCAIAAIDGSAYPGSGQDVMRACYATTKYCTAFLRGVSCNDRGCMGQHEWGDKQDRFKKADLTYARSMRTTESRSGTSKKSEGSGRAAFMENPGSVREPDLQERTIPSTSSATPTSRRGKAFQSRSATIPPPNASSSSAASSTRPYRQRDSTSSSHPSTSSSSSSSLSQIPVTSSDVITLRYKEKKQQSSQDMPPNRSLTVDSDLSPWVPRLQPGTSNVARDGTSACRPRTMPNDDTTQGNLPLPNKMSLPEVGGDYVNNDTWATMERMQFRRLSIPDAMNYLENVKTQLAGFPDLYRRFLILLIDWRCKRITNVDVVIKAMSSILRRYPDLLRDFNILLAGHDRRVECASHRQEIGLITIITPLGSWISVIPEARNALDVPAFGVTNTAQLRRSFGPSEYWRVLLELKHEWAGCTQELMQSELDRLACDDGNQQPPYRRKLLRCMRQLLRESGELPPSLYLYNTMCEGKTVIYGGGYADIMKGRWNEKPVCCKVLRIFTEAGVSDADFKAFQNEALVWRQLRHPNILPFYGINNTLFGTRICLVSPWMENSNIMSYLKSHPEHDRITSITEIAEGLQYLHGFEPNIIHGDLKGANILVTDDSRCCLGDFGLATIAETHTVGRSNTETVKGTCRWMAPELMAHSKFPECPTGATKATDVYSFACTAFEILSGKPPFSEHRTDVAVMFAVIDGKRPSRLAVIEHCPDDVWMIIDACWAHRPPQNRPTIDDIVSVIKALPDVGDICDRVQSHHSSDGVSAGVGPSGLTRR